MPRDLDRFSGDPLPPPEGTDILSRECEPFALAAFVGEASVPVGFDADRIVCFDTVNSRRRNRYLDRQFTFTPPQ